MALAVGFHQIASDIYHSDPCEEPSLSHSILRILLDQSPMHARYRHPKLSPTPIADKPSEAKDEGAILHHLMLGGGAAPVVVAADDWRTNAAKEKRDAARAAKRVPILAHKYADLCKCAEAVLSQMREHPGCVEFFAPGRSEVTMIWKEADVVWCRGLVDRLPDQDGAPLFDLKSTGMSASPVEWEWTLRKKYATAAVFYLRGANALGRVASEKRFVTFEREAPYGVSVTAPGASLLEAASAEVKRGVMLWAKSVITGEWPGYPAEVAYVEASLQQMIAAETIQPAPLAHAA